MEKEIEYLENKIKLLKKDVNEKNELLNLVYDKFKEAYLYCDDVNLIRCFLEANKILGIE